ncbi:MAG: 1-propanol dehydrogenase PduQ [Clostridiales bacterium]
MNHFIVKTKIFCGDKALENIGNLKINKACIVCDKFVEDSGMLNELFALLESLNVSYSVFSDVIPDPDYNIVAKGVAAIEKSGSDAIISVGGGSVLDTGKLVGLIYGRSSELPCPILIEIPTTAGTGSEVTSFSVITNPDDNSKFPIVDDDMLPDYAILDARFTQSIPPSVTADTGFDVLTHALEAYVSTEATVFSDALAEKAISLVCRNLPIAVKDGENIEARTAMLNASCMAGIAFNHAKLGLCHGMAHAFGGQFHIAHGRANSLFLPEVISFNGGLDRDIAVSCTPIRKKYAIIASKLGFQAKNDKELTLCLVETIKELRKMVDLPQRVRDLGITETDYMAALDILTEQAMRDSSTITNPVAPHMAQTKTLFINAF